MHVPLVISGPGVEPGVSDDAVSTRQVFYTLLDWAGLGSQLSLRSKDARPLTSSSTRAPARLRTL